MFPVEHFSPNFYLFFYYRHVNENQRVAKTRTVLRELQTDHPNRLTLTIITITAPVTTILPHRTMLQWYQILSTVSISTIFFQFPSNIHSKLIKNFPIFIELRTLTALVQQPLGASAMHSNSSPTLNGSISGQVDSSNHTPPLTPHSYTQQIPSPIFSSANIVPNSSRASYLPYGTVTQSQPMVELYTSAAYSPLSSPYYSMSGSGLIGEHDVKLEAMSHSCMHGIQQSHHNSHQPMLHMSRSPSDDERDLQSHIMRQERPTVLNIKTEQ